MKLYLTSYRLPTPETVFSMLDVALEDAQLGIILNAKDYKDPAGREEKLLQLEQDLSAYGFKHISFIDLRKFINDDERLHATLAGLDVLYCAGGSTPALRLAMKQTSYDAAFKAYLDAGKLYIGESAGAYVMGPSIKVAEESDRHIGLSELPEDGLGIIDDVVVPHADNPDYADDMVHIESQMRADGHSVVLLNDNQAYVVADTIKRIETGDNSRYDNRPRS